MPLGRKPGQIFGSKPFKKGYDPRRHLKGRGKVPPEVRALRELTTREFIEKVNKYLYFKEEKLTSIIESPDSEVLDLCICKALVRCINGKDGEGEYELFDKILDRIIGQTQLKMKLDGSLKNTQEITIPDEALAALGDAIVRAEAKNKQ